MKFFLAFAWKNLSRHTKRTLITASAIAFGLMTFLFVDSLLIGGEKDSERNLIWYETASLRIYQNENFNSWKKATLKHLIDNPSEIVRPLEDAGVRATTRTVFTGEMVVNKDPFPEDGSLHVRVTAVDPLKDTTVYKFQDALTEDSQWIEAGSNQAIMGQWLAEDIGADVGYPITIVTRTRGGAYQTIDLEIVGLAYTGNPIVNRNAILMDQTYADELLLLDGSVSQIDIAYPVIANTEDELAVVKELIPATRQDIGLFTWQTLAADYLSLAATKQSGSIMMLGFVFFIALIGISNTMLLAMYERRREIGMMRALGMKNHEIVINFLLEAGGIGVIGGAIGILLGIGVVAFGVEIGLNYGFILRDFDAGYRIASIFRGVWRPAMFVIAFMASIFMSMIAALIPTRAALKMSVSDCLRAET